MYICNGRVCHQNPVDDVENSEEEREQYSEREKITRSAQFRSAQINSDSTSVKLILSAV